MNTAEYIKQKKKCLPKPKHPKQNLNELHQLLGNMLHQESAISEGALDLSVHQRQRVTAPSEMISHLP